LKTENFGDDLQNKPNQEREMERPLESIEFVCYDKNVAPSRGLAPTTNPFVQRAGTWTLYDHLRAFVDSRGAEWQVIGVQSCGDLTMNPWHVAYLGNSHIPSQQKMLCALLTEGDPTEPYASRVYRCLVRWRDDVAKAHGTTYEFLDLKFSRIANGYAVRLYDSLTVEKYDSWLREYESYNFQSHDIGALIEFAIAGKPVVEKGVELALSNAIDRFQDVRHIFNLPTVKAEGFLDGHKITEINFGEYQLFNKLNERRAALLSSVIIDLAPVSHVKVDIDDLYSKLKERHFRQTSESPTRRGEYRRYTDDISRDKMEIFFPHNVYPFGVLGVHGEEIVCLASGGLSGRVGNTLEGITRIMFDFFGCEDAMVLDEGYDTFQISNPMEKGRYKYSNSQLLGKVLAFTKELVNSEQEQSLQRENAEAKSGVPYKFSGGLIEYPLNKELFMRINEEKLKPEDVEFDDVLVVRPLRSQMRSVIICAVRQR
jgi:hypothetical protein